MPLADWDDNVIDLILGVATPLITTGGLVIIGWWQHGKLRKIERHTSATKEQVQNSHTTNLRDDLDSLHASVDAISTKQDRMDAKLGTVAAKHDLVAIQAQVEHSKLWDAITGGEPPMPPTSDIEIQEAARKKES